MHCGYVVKVEHIRKHENADKLQIATFFGNDTVVDLSVNVGDIGVYFPVDLQLSEEYCEKNNLVRKKDENGNNVGGFLDPDKRNIKAIKLRGEKSDGLFMPLESFAYCWDLDKEDVPEECDITIPMGLGDQITILNGHEICKKYIPNRQNKQGGYSNGNKVRKHKVPYAPLFMEHADTSQLAYNHGAFKVNDEIEITLKMHGTSQRTGYLPVLQPTKKTFWQKLFKKEPAPVYKYDYVTGTRRVVLENFDGEGGFYGSNEFRGQHHNAFVGKLNKGETVYYEVVGFTHNGAPIMSDGSNKGLGKDFINQYGETTRFSYGCSPDVLVKSKYVGIDSIETAYSVNPKPQSDIYVYRMTMTNEDGYVVEYTPDLVRYRCEQMGVKTVPVFTRFILHDYDVENDDRTLGQIVQDCAEKYYDGPDPIGKTHVREGVVTRIVNRPGFVAYKHKNFSFKVIEGIAKDVATAPDMEEAQEIDCGPEENVE